MQNLAPSLKGMCVQCMVSSYLSDLLKTTFLALLTGPFNSQQDSCLGYLDRIAWTELALDTVTITSIKNYIA